MSDSSASRSSSRVPAHESSAVFAHASLPAGPRYRMYLLPLLLLAALLATAWLTASQITQSREADRESDRQRMALWVKSEQRLLAGQLQENGYWEEAVTRFLREPELDTTWLEYMYGPEFAINTGIHLISAVRGDGQVAAWVQHNAGSPGADWLGKQPVSWRRALAPVMQAARQSPTQPQLAWLIVDNQPWLIGMQGLYEDEEALPPRDEQGLLILGMPLTTDLLDEQAAVLGLKGLQVVSNAMPQPIATQQICVALPASGRADRYNHAKACWQDENRVAQLLQEMGTPLAVLLLIILLAGMGTIGMLVRDSRRRRASRAYGAYLEHQYQRHSILNQQFLSVPYETHTPQNARASLTRYLQRVREMLGAEIIIYRREVGNPNAGYLILQSHDEREWLSEASLRRDPLWRLPVGRVCVSAGDRSRRDDDGSVDRSVDEQEDRALLLCQRLGASQLMGYSVSPHPGRSELLLVASRGHRLNPTEMMPLLDMTLDTLVVRGLEQERVLLQQQLLKEREMDLDTGLLSREGMLRMIKVRIDQLGEVAPMEGFVLMALRIGGLQVLYDHAGAEPGNYQLEQVQKRIAPLLGNSGDVARLETDRLLIMVQRRLLEATRGGISGWLDNLLNAVRDKVTLDDEVIYLQPSLGITRYPEDGHQVDALVYRAERALHDTQQCQREWHFFDDEAERELRRLKQLEAEFTVALRENQLRLFVQPIVDGRTGRLQLSEALIRWQHPEHGLMGSADFMAIVESARLDVALGRWVLKESIATLMHVHESGHELHLSVNVTVRHMMDKRFLSDLEMLFRHPELCERLTLELVESQLPDDIQALAVLFQTIRAHGVALALDDFGTGYSSLSQLQRLPFDKLKIDRQFVTALGSSKGQAMIEAMLGLAEAFHLAVVAEGIETPEQRAELLAHGCSLHQGYLYARPMPVQELIEHLIAGDGWLPEGL
ncbi:EAL domain-containing protein [Cobetia amphilecti]|uniref:EAL domain-containing protein n=1 Tax=Cobetia amphilecti TaxID=1055104 RepID=A0ABT6UQF5_9GAMM|nr:EAL domain-containing protein [Cobetia amphilecti]MBR9799982.1 EAL domain-containing protein [Gammaproteobacteria bacterium]MDI5884932.1 EAL domain-containing protein [Cobetia amphilecti]WOI24755.1 EAL domain-containing protein [Cobetia amphilecti]